MQVCLSYRGAEKEKTHILEHARLQSNPPYDEKVHKTLPNSFPEWKEQASTATTTTHPLFMSPFTPEKLKNEI